ncbi:hypothetical protein [Kribbella steppae]|uniref:hypothetical protein n=1 Tax=Kribbella steppae TaxID=2512223 RepID=UPI001A7E24F1|nr:hypothetical protein [Kribbella steppae]
MAAIDTADARWAQITACLLIAVGALAFFLVYWLRRNRKSGDMLTGGVVVLVAIATCVVLIAGKTPSSGSPESTPNTKPSASGPSTDDYQGPWGAAGYQGGWGPERDTFTMNMPAPYPAFNSITDNPRHGDERNFVQIKRATAGNKTYGEDVAFEAGKQYEVYALFSNDAMETKDPSLIARDVRLKLLLGKPATEVGVGAMVTSANAEDVWDGSHVAGDSKFSITYVKGSARIYTLSLNGAPLPDKDLLTSGAMLGCKRLDGVIPPAGCSGYVTLRVVARSAE